jgi:adenylate kinase
MYVIFLGPPGAGKGTQGALMSARLGIPRVATGDLLRSAVREGTPLGLQAKAYMDAGLLVPDDVILGLIGEVLDSPEARNGIVMDGFPRTVAQAEAVGRILERRGVGVNHVISVEVPREDLVRRLTGRASEQGRSHDAPEAITKRLAVYTAETAPLIAYYQDLGLLRSVDGTGSVEAIATRIEGTAG